MKTADPGSPYPTDYILQCMLVTIVYRLSHSAAQRGLATQTVTSHDRILELMCLWTSNYEISIT